VGGAAQSRRLIPVNTDSRPTIDVIPTDLTRVFHRLNNQLGVILANAELLEARLTDETQRARASLVVSGALDAITTIQDLRRQVGVRQA
jgi:hypothetical protein